MGQSGSCDAALTNSTANSTVIYTTIGYTINATDDDFPHYLYWSIEEMQVISYAHDSPELIYSNSVKKNVLHISPTFIFYLFFSFADNHLACLLIYSWALLHIYCNSFDLRRGLARTF